MERLLNSIIIEGRITSMSPMITTVDGIDRCTILISTPQNYNLDNDDGWNIGVNLVSVSGKDCTRIIRDYRIGSLVRVCGRLHQNGADNENPFVFIVSEKIELRPELTTSGQGNLEF